MSRELTEAEVRTLLGAIAAGAPAPPGTQAVVRSGRVRMMRNALASLVSISLLAAGGIAVARRVVPEPGIRPAAGSGLSASWDIWIVRPGTPYGIRAVAQTPDDEEDPAISPDGTTVAYARRRDLSTVEIWTVGIDGSNPRRITEGHEDGRPAWSPDGRSLVFGRVTEEKREGDAILDGRAGLFVVGLDGSEPRKIYDDAHSPAWAPDGRRIAFVRRTGPGTRIFVGSVNGEAPRAITSPSEFREERDGSTIFANVSDFEPAWSADGARMLFMRQDQLGQRIFSVDAQDGSDLRFLAYGRSPAGAADGRTIAFDAGSRIRVAAPDGSAARPVTFDPLATDWHASLAADGSVVAFQREFYPWGAIHVAEADGSNPRRISEHEVAHQPVASPDGSRIAYVSARDGYSAIWTMNADGSSVRRLTDDVKGASQPAWSPDGRRVAFVSLRDGDADIYEMRADGGEVRRVTGAPGDELWPRWSPDGREISFEHRRSRPGAEPLVDVGIIDAAGGEVRLLTGDGKSRSPVWSPAGERIAFLRLLSGDRPYPGSYGVAGSVAKRVEDVFTMRSDGTDVRRVTTDATFAERLSGWAPDDRIVYRGANETNSQDGIQALDPGTGRATQLVHEPVPGSAPAAHSAPSSSQSWRYAFGTRDPSWMPDGRLLFSGYLGSGLSLPVP